MALLICSFVIVVGCGGGKKDDNKKPEPPKKEEKAPPQGHRVNIGVGKGHRYSLSGKREKLWTVRWKSAVMDVYEEGGDLTGVLTGVDGDIFKGNKIVSKFEGKESKVDKAKEVLILEGEVKIYSIDPPATMYCDRLRYEADKEIVKASGNIRVVSATGTVTGLNELWTNPEMTKVATPDMWSERP